jgi:hypothetical protein
MVVSCSAAPMPATIRHAEKRRKSTCAFAERIASEAICKFRSHEESSNFRQQQTVLAAILVYFEDVDQLHVRTVHHEECADKQLFFGELVAARSFGDSNGWQDESTVVP